MRNEFAPIHNFLSALANEDFIKYDIFFLEQVIEKRMFNLNCHSAKDYYNVLTSDSNEANMLADSLQISFSEFFRNRLTYEVLETVVLPEIISNNLSANRKEIRIWSMACAGGHEAYSLAIILKEIADLHGGKIKFRIFATDQNEIQINLAQQGIYHAKSFDNLCVGRLNRWFTLINGSYVVSDELKHFINFSVFDLLDKNHNCPPESIYGDFDLVMCANLLFYYKPIHQKIILEKALHSTTSGGCIVTGEIEREILIKNKFVEMFPQSAIFRK